MKRQPSLVSAGSMLGYDSSQKQREHLRNDCTNQGLCNWSDTEGLRLLIPQNFQVLIPSPQFEAATIANIDSIFGPTSASEAFYKKIFDLYNAASAA